MSKSVSHRTWAQGAFSRDSAPANWREATGQWEFSSHPSRPGCFPVAKAVWILGLNHLFVAQFAGLLDYFLISRSSSYVGYIGPYDEN